MSCPTCTPAKVWRTLPGQFAVAWVLKNAAAAPGAMTVPVEFEVNLLVTSPPTPRIQTPPPGWLGFGSPGAETKALPCWLRKAVLMFPKAPAKEPAAAPPAAAAACNWPPKRGAPGPEAVVVQFCANAPEPVEIATAKANPARTRPSRAFNLRFMERAPEFQFQQKIKLQALCKGDSHTLEVRNDPRARSGHDFRRLCYKGNMIV